MLFFFFFLNQRAPPKFQLLPLRDPLPLKTNRRIVPIPADLSKDADAKTFVAQAHKALGRIDILVNKDRKSTRLNSSHGYISYAVFCLKKKKMPHEHATLLKTFISL